MKRRPLAIRRRDLKPGDLILDPTGQPYFRVVELRHGSDHRKFIVIGDQLCRGITPSGNGDTLLPVLRQETK
jgi:hypothetical protein